jgi:hypothetical protein
MPKPWLERRPRLIVDRSQIILCHTGNQQEERNKKLQHSKQESVWQVTYYFFFKKA